MTTIRQSARYGAVVSLLASIGCLSSDEPMFRSVAAPDRVEASQASPDPIPTPTAVVVPAPEGGSQQSYSEQILELRPLLEPDGGKAAAPDDPVAEAGAAAPAASDPCRSKGILFCDSFEDSTPGLFPDSGKWLPELSGCGSHTVDDSGVSHSGSSALRATAGGYPECMLHADLSGEADVYVRSWIRLGSEPALLGQYLSLLEFGSGQSQDEPELRVGLRPAKDSLCPLVPGLDLSVTGLLGGPDTACLGVRLLPERWYCAQAHLSRQAGRLSFSLSIDGVSAIEQEYAQLANGWSGSGLFFKLGRAAYGASSDGSVWHDDVAVSREPVPCDP